MIDPVKDIAIAAGKQILAIYQDETLSNKVEHKSDDSPLHWQLRFLMTLRLGDNNFIRKFRTSAA